MATKPIARLIVSSKMEPVIHCNGTASLAELEALLLEHPLIINAAVIGGYLSTSSLDSKLAL